MTLVEEVELEISNNNMFYFQEGIELLQRLSKALEKSNSALSTVVLKAPGYDWNSDPEELTKLTGEAFALFENRK